MQYNLRKCEIDVSGLVQFFLLDLQSKAPLGTLSLTLVTLSFLKVFPHTWGQIY